MSDGSNKYRLLRRKARRQETDVRLVRGHRFALQQLKVKMVCDHCSKVIGVLEKGDVCRSECPNRYILYMYSVYDRT